MLFSYYLRRPFHDRVTRNQHLLSYLSPRFSSSSSGLGNIGNYGFSGSGGTNKKAIIQKAFGKLSRSINFDTFITGIALLAFSLFLIIFFFNALQGIGRKRRTSSGELDFFILPSDYVFSGQFLFDVFQPNSALYLDYIPAVAKLVSSVPSNFLKAVGSGVKGTVLDVVGTSRGPGNSRTDNSEVEFGPADQGVT